MRLLSDKKYVWSGKKRKGFWYRLNFITLTLSDIQSHSDEFVLTHMFQPFLKWLQREANVINYVWRVEVQEKRFRKYNHRCIHFHITTNKFIHWKKVRGKWNDIQAHHGYTNYSDDPNSTDVHAVYNEGKLVNYISKYMSKTVTDEKLRVYCKIWGCNHGLSNLKAVIKEEDSTHFWNHLWWYKKHMVTKENRMQYLTQYQHNFLRGGKMTGIIERELMRCYEQFQMDDDGITKYKVD